ncbi:ATP-binding protein [Streptomyces sp. CB02923]|nr:ATP-binding protein [Streptomyces sp. CB02923]
MRHRTREALVGRGLPYIADDAELVVSELVTNAVMHSGGRKITVALTLRDGCLRITVGDGTPGNTALPTPPEDADEHGRGLFLVQSIAAGQKGAWGISGNGATTWCDLAVG